jgi:hypothetical protein
VRISKALETAPRVEELRETMNLETKEGFRSKLALRIAIASQIAILFAMYFSTRTSLVWTGVIASFIPATIIALTTVEKKYILASLLILFASQQAVFIFSHPSWGYDYFSDSINDFQVASIISETGHFVLGQTGYSRADYSYYPLLHIFSAALSKVSGLSLVFIALYIVPLLSALLTSICLYYLNFELFGLQGRTRNLATLLFEASYFYTYFQAQFIREVFAFPFVLLALLIVLKMIKRPIREYWFLLPILFICVTLSHHISSYLLLFILALITINLKILHNNRSNRPLLLLTIIIISYTSFVTFNLFVGQVIATYSALGTTLQMTGLGAPVMEAYDPLRRYLAYAHYGIIGAFVLIGGTKLVLDVRKKHLAITPKISLAAFSVFSFLVCMIIRVSSLLGTWGYYVALRGTIWSFIGISFIMAIGINYIFDLHLSQASAHVSYRKLLIVLVIFCLIAAGKFSQYPLNISTSSTESPVTYSRYVAASWLREVTKQGDYLLVAPELNDSEAFESSREMAAYAYLYEYNLAWMSYGKFEGYVPFVGKFFEKFQNSSDVQTIYSNGETVLGYKYP